MERILFSEASPAHTAALPGGGAAQLSWARRGQGAELTIALPYAGAFGMGEKYNALNQKGRTAVNRVEEQFCFQGGHTYCPAPFFWTDSGFGLCVASDRESAFSFGKAITVTLPAGAGNVPEANYKMIAALSVMKGQIERADIPKFVAERGMPGFVPTQGHIPSGVPYIGHALEALKAGTIKRAMIIGKGSLFLGRLTNLADGASFIMEGPGAGTEPAQGVSQSDVTEMLLAALSDVAANLQKD